MTSNQEVDALKEQVERLSGFLHAYQEKYPPLEGPQSKASTLIPPWHVDQRLVSPLMVEYENLLQKYQEENEKYKWQQKSLQKDMDQLLAENERLARELQDTISDRIKPLKATEISPDQDLAALDNLQMQLQLTIQERDASHDLVRASKIEVERLEGELTELRRTNITSSHWQQLQAQHEQTKVKFTSMIGQLNNELRMAQDNLRTEKEAKAIVETKMQDAKRSMMIAQQGDKAQEHSYLLQVEERFNGMEAQMAEKNVILAEMQAEVGSLADVVEHQVKEIRLLTAQSDEKDERIIDITDRLKTTVETAEAAVLQRNEVEIVAKQLEAEIQRLREELNALCDEAGRRTKEEVDKVNVYSTKKINKLNDNIHSLEMENGAVKAELERAMREKKAVESELEKVYQEGMQQAYRDGGRYDQLNKRACDAEMERDEVTMKYKSTEAELQRMEMRVANEKLKHDREMDRLTERVCSLQKDFDRVNDDRLRHLEEAMAAQQNADALKRDTEVSVRNHRKEITCLEHALSMKQRDFEMKLQSNEEAHRHALGKAREEVTRQQQASNKWKEEHAYLSDKWEKTVTSLREDNSEKEKRVEELSGLLREARDKTVDAESVMKEYTNQIRKIELRTKESERRNADAMKQIANKDRKIRQLLHERIGLNNPTGQATQHSNINASFSTYKDPLLFPNDVPMAGGDFMTSTSPIILGELSTNHRLRGSRSQQTEEFKENIDQELSYGQL